MDAEKEKMSRGRKVGLGCLGALVVLVGIPMAFNATLTPEEKAKYAAEREAREKADTEEKAAKEAKKAQDKIDGAMKLTARELWNAYNNNEVAAQSAFKGRDMLITGTVSSIELDFTDDPQVTFVSPNQFMEVMAGFKGDATEQTSALRKGQKLTVMCDGVSEIAGRPILRDCTIME